ncbi:MAG: hypothetical protein JWQ04_2645 [Pedosphaera sp.]|nr:hypothetical protein [Pedosphaera sp.]
MIPFPKKHRATRKNILPFPNLFLNRWLLALALLGFVPPSHALTLPELLNDAHLTPERLLHRFARFKFKLFDGVQPPVQFLASETGDCDDFATLAAYVLREKGYHPRLIAVFMPTQVHVVCVVTEAKAYLDYNNRRQDSPLVPTDGSLTDIAGKVARSFHTTWRCVCEYTVKDGVQHTVSTEFR